jgi:hypothetical protein
LKAFLSLLLAASASPVWISLAAAQTPGVHLVWERPVGSLCPSREALEADVEQVMGRRIFTSPANARLIVRGVVEDGSTGARVRIDAQSAKGAVLGTRELSAPPGRCASLRGAIALVLTLFVERDDGSAEQAGESTNARFGLGASFTVTSTPLPRTAVAGGPSLSLELLGALLRFQVDAEYWAPVSVETRRGVGAKIGAFSLAVRACGRLWGEAGTLVLRLCAGADLGALVASPLQLAGPRQQTRLLAHGMLDVRGEVPLGSDVMLAFAVGPLLSLSRPTFSYLRSDGELRDVYRPHLGGVIFQVTFIILGS